MHGLGAKELWLLGGGGGGGGGGVPLTDIYDWGISWSSYSITQVRA